jgi:exodeoxyribonuclease-3
MKLVSWNVNGIRACVKKGFLTYLEEENPDILCIQESKALPTDLEDHVLTPRGYHTMWHSAQKKGYSGVALFSKKKPKLALHGIGVDRFDSEGRVVMAEYDNFVIFGVYFPNGQMGPERLQYKLDFYDAFFKVTNDMVKEGKNVIICGDYNTAHKEIDLARPKENEENSGFLPIEREWMDRIETWGYVDTFRQFNTQPEQYTWWTYRAGARQRNIGWRIDYFWVNKAFMPFVESAFIQPHIHGSDHCPVGITLKNV